MAARARRSGRCSRSSTSRSASCGCRAWPRTSAAIPAAASRPSATSPACSTATRCTGRRWSAPGARATTPASRPTPRGRPSSTGGCALASASPTRPSASRARARACANSPTWPTCRRASALFGLTRLPRGHVDVLEALAAGRDVHLFVLHPSPALWEKVAGRPKALRRREDETAALPQNRLLASWGHDSRELQLVLDEYADHHHPVETAGDSLLHRLQAGVRDDEAPDTTPIDRSVQIHSCHGRARQVEVLRAAILHELAEDPTLEPRDVIVMCPDIETFAPLIQATFGTGDESDLRVRLADRSLRQTNPVLGVVARLLELAGRAPHRLAGARPRRPRARPPPLRLRRRQARSDRGVGPRERHPLGARRRPPGAVQARRAAERHVARPGSTGCCSAWR